MIAYGAHGPARASGRRGAAPAFDAHVADLGYALLLKRYAPDVGDATPAQIDAAAWDTVPAVLPLFWSFRVMVGLGFYFIALFATMFWLASSRQLGTLPRAAVGLPVVAAAALGRRRARLVRRRGRAPAVDDRRRAADLPLGLERAGVGRLALARRLRAVLFGARGGRCFLMVRTIRHGPASPPHGADSRPRELARIA